MCYWSKEAVQLIMSVNIYAVTWWLYIIVRLVEVNKFAREDCDCFELTSSTPCRAKIHGSSCYLFLFWTSLAPCRSGWPCAPRRPRFFSNGSYLQFRRHLYGWAKRSDDYSVCKRIRWQIVFSKIEFCTLCDSQR